METSRIVENILTFSKTLRLELKSVDVGDILSASIGDVQNPNRIPIITHIDKVLPKISVDEIQIKRVFINIISNALQAMEEKGTLTIEASRVNDSVGILFKDTGPGIKEEDKKRLFEPFFSTKSKGIGLGLTMSKNVVEAHGGKITIESEAGKGTVVTIKLSACHQADQSQDKTEDKNGEGR
jgi:signal transduction histidine kinase